MAQNLFSIIKFVAVIQCDMQQPFLFLSHVKYNAYREEIVENLKFRFTLLSHHISTLIISVMILMTGIRFMIAKGKQSL